MTDEFLRARKPRPAGRARDRSQARRSPPMTSGRARDLLGDQPATRYAATGRGVGSAPIDRRRPDRRRTAALPRARPRPRSGAAASAAARSRRRVSAAQRVSTRSTMRRLSRAAAARLADEAALAHRLDRLAERRIGRGRQPGLVVERAEAGAAAVVDIAARRASSGTPDKLGQRLLEQLDIAGQQRAQDQAGGELAALAQMAASAADLARPACRRRARRSPSRRPRA